MPRLRVSAFLLLAGLIALIGCGKGRNYVPVEGTLTVKGKAIDKIQVEFWPEGAGTRSMGVTDANGHYSLTSDDGKTKGAVVGKHRIVLHDVGIQENTLKGLRAAESVDLTKGKKSRVNAKYGDPEKTPLKKDVTSGKNIIDIEASP